jgi:hypothetical protein
MKFKLRNQNQAGAAPILIVIIIVTLLAIGGVIWYVVMRNNEDDNGNQSEETQQTVIEGTMFDAISQGQALECDWTLNYDGQAQLTKGKFYTDGLTNGRAESRYEYDEQTYVTNAIINVDRTYHWSVPVRGEKVQGISDVRAKYEAREPDYRNADNSADVVLNYDYTFNCQPWTVDESIFVAPDDLQFLILE